MSKIFLSHSSANNAHALALAQWLRECGWDDYFLDLAPAQGLRPGERWQEALRKAAHRCEAIVLLLSPAWCESRWCQTEFLLAKQLHKNIFGVIVEPTSLERLPNELTTEHQLCDLTAGSSRREFQVAQDPVVPPTRVQFGQEALGHLKLGLEKSGLSPLTFSWPPPGDPDRAPYRGLKALDVEDAAVFFGREAPIVNALDMLRGMRERRVEQVMVILGASGAGKSSLLRAGLWPRIQRDDRHFLPLPIVRPERAAISGDFGLADSLAMAFKRYGVTRSRGEIREQLGTIDGLRALLQNLSAIACNALGAVAVAPTIVLPIDQAEELFAAESSAEAELFLELLGSLLRETIERQTISPVVALMTIRSDAYEQLQNAESLRDLRVAPFDLKPIGQTEFRAVIEGPATRATEAGNALQVDPKLTEALLQDAEGADALPLLAFIMERMFVEYGADGALTLAEYEKLGGIRGAVERAVQNALCDPQAAPAIPVDKNEQLRRLKAGFVPWLAAVDIVTNERRRRVARWADIPEEAHPLLERLVHARLLSRDQRVCPGGGVAEPVVEIAHESLLRQWPALRQWLEAETRNLVTVAGIETASQEWTRQNCSEDFLVHARGRLEGAEALMKQREYSQRVGRPGLEYLAACRAKEDVAKSEREAQIARTEQEQKRVAHEQGRRARAQRFMTAALVSVLGVVIVAGLLVQRQKAITTRQSALVLISAARNAPYPEQALRLATVSARVAPTDELAELADVHLRRSAFASDLKVLFKHEDPVNSAALSPSGDRILTVSEKAVTIWNAATGEIVAAFAADKASDASFSPSGRHLLTQAKAGGTDTSEILRMPDGERIGTLLGRDPTIALDESYVVSRTDEGLNLLELKPKPREPQEQPLPSETSVAALSPSGSLAVLAGDSEAMIWDIRKQRTVGSLEESQDACDFAFAPDDRRIAGWCEERVEVWDIETGRRVTRLASPDQADFRLTLVTFSPDAQRIAAIDIKNKVAYIWNASTGGRIATIEQDSDVSVEAPSFNPDGSSLALASNDATVELWDIASRKRIVSLKGHSVGVSDISFSADGRTVLTASKDGTARLWNTGPKERAVRLEGLGSEVYAGKLSRYGERVIAGSSRPRKAGVWDCRTGRLLLPLPEQTMEVAISGDGRRALTIELDSGTRVWDVENGQLIGTSHALEATGAVLNASGTHAVLSGKDSWQLWSVDDDKHEALGRLSGPVLFSPDGTRLLMSSQDGSAVLRSVDDRQQFATLHGYPDTAIGLAFDATSSSFIAVSEDGNAITWSLLRGAAMQSSVKLALRGLSKRSFVKFSGDLQFALSGQVGALWIVDVKHGVPLARMPLIARRADVSHKGSGGISGLFEDVLRAALPVSDAALSKDNRNAIAVDRDGLVHLFQTGLIAEPDSAVTLRTVCQERLVGFSKVTTADIEIAPVLERLEGQDVCADEFDL